MKTYEIIVSIHHRILMAGVSEQEVAEIAKMRLTNLIAAAGPGGSCDYEVREYSPKPNEKGQVLYP